MEMSFKSCILGGPCRPCRQLVDPSVPSLAVISSHANLAWDLINLEICKLFTLSLICFAYHQGFNELPFRVQFFSSGIFSQVIHPICTSENRRMTFHHCSISDRSFQVKESVKNLPTSITNEKENNQELKGPQNSPSNKSISIYCFSFGLSDTQGILSCSLTNDIR